MEVMVQIGKMGANKICSRGEGTKDKNIKWLFSFIAEKCER